MKMGGKVIFFFPTYKEIGFIPFLLLQMYSALHANKNFICDIKT